MRPTTQIASIGGTRAAFDVLVTNVNKDLNNARDGSGNKLPGMYDARQTRVQILIDVFSNYRAVVRFTQYI